MKCQNRGWHFPVKNMYKFLSINHVVLSAGHDYLAVKLSAIAWLKEFQQN